MPVLPRRIDQVVADLADDVALLKKQAIQQTDWLPLTLQNSWVVFDSTFNQPEYIRIGRVVYVRGLIKNGTLTAGTVLATLPAGYRPGHAYLFTTMNNSVLQRVDVASNGNISLGFAASSTAWLSLDPIVFPVDKV